MENKGSLEPEDIDIIRRRSLQISSLIQRSITLADAGLIIGTKEKVNLNNLVHEIAEVIIPSSVEVKISELPELPADKEKVYQVVKNLLENAVVHSQPTTIEISAKITDKVIFLLFSNDGTPVHADIRNKLLEPDISHEEAGRGQGLQIIKRIVEAHGWKISLEQSGNTFIISIPRIFG
jgi:signal transduction histidine kinase